MITIMSPDRSVQEYLLDFAQNCTVVRITSNVNLAHTVTIESGGNESDFREDRPPGQLRLPQSLLVNLCPCWGVMWARPK